METRTIGGLVFEGTREDLIEIWRVCFDFREATGWYFHNRHRLASFGFASVGF